MNAPYPCYVQYYQTDSPNLWSYASAFALCDNCFSSLSGPSFPNHQYTIASQSGQSVSNPTPKINFAWGCDSDSTTTVEILVSGLPLTYVYPCFDYPTLADELDAAGYSWHYYSASFGKAGYQWSAYDAINHIRNGPDWANVLDYTQFAIDAAAGTLPTISWVTPDSQDSQHPSSSWSKGENWIATNINALMSGPDWASTVVFLFWDDWGGFYDHVPPPSVDFYGTGIRVPLLVISPYAKPGYITSSNTQIPYYSFDSVLAYVEHTFGLQPLTSRDAVAADLTDTLNYSQPPRPGFQVQLRPAPKNLKPVIVDEIPVPDEPGDDDDE